jgi:hypothetical protein
MKACFIALITLLFFGCSTPNPSACIGTNLAQGIISLRDTLVLDGSCSSDTKKYHWDFGDGTSADGVIAKHIYTKEGVFYITLAASNSKKADTASVVFSVQK